MRVTHGFYPVAGHNLPSRRLVGCATPPPASDPGAVAEFQQANDPLEPTNRVLYKVNTALDDYVLRPAAVAYRDALPQPVRNAIHNQLNNLAPR